MANPIVTSLPQYVEQQRLPLIRQAVLGSKSLKYLNLQTDIKSQAALNLLNTTIEFGNGGDCGWSDKGSTTLTQRILKTGQIKVNMSFCDKKLLPYWANYQVKIAAGQKTLPFEEDFIGGIIDGVIENNEKMIWQGCTSDCVEDYPLAENNNKFNGIAPNLYEESATNGVIKKNLGTGITAYNAIKTVYLSIPQKVADKAVIFVGADLFKTFLQELVEKNYYHYSANEIAPDEIYFPGSMTKVVAVNGLNKFPEYNQTRNFIIAADPANLFYGCDMMNGEEKVEMWYSQDNREFRLAIEYNAGTQVAYPDECVLGIIGDNL